MLLLHKMTNVDTRSSYQPPPFQMNSVSKVIFALTDILTDTHMSMVNVGLADLKSYEQRK